MKKKIVCAMMCVAMVATSLVGCGSKADDTATDNAGTETTDDDGSYAHQGCPHGHIG